MLINQLFLIDKENKQEIRQRPKRTEIWPNRNGVDSSITTPGGVNQDGPQRRGPNATAGKVKGCGA